MASAFRYADTSRAAKVGRTRTGLAAVGNSSGGTAPYQLAALQPGARGYWASSFGMAPTTGGLEAKTPEAPPAAEQKPADTPATAPELLDPFVGADARGGNMAEGSGANDIGGNPRGPAMDLGGFGDFAITGADIGKFGGGVLGGVLGGPLGALMGTAVGYALGKAYDSSHDNQQGTGRAAQVPGDVTGTSYEGQEQEIARSMDQANIDSGMAGTAYEGQAPGQAVQGEVTAEPLGPPTGAYSRGGVVTPAGLQKGKQMMQHYGRKPGGGLRQVGERYMGGYAYGGSVPNYAYGGMVDQHVLAGPNPPGPDDGFAALDGGEYVVRAQQAQRPDYAPILQQINAGTYDPEKDDGMGDEPVYTNGSSIQDGNAGSRITALDASEREAIMAAMQRDPMLKMALMDLLGPEGMSMLMYVPPSETGVDTATFQSSRAPLQGPPIPPGTASPPGFPPPSQRARGGLGSVGA
jgi:hypothetical protein